MAITPETTPGPGSTPTQAELDADVEAAFAGAYAAFGSAPDGTAAASTPTRNGRGIRFLRIGNPFTRRRPGPEAAAVAVPDPSAEAEARTDDELAAALGRPLDPGERAGVGEATGRAMGSRMPHILGGATIGEYLSAIPRGILKTITDPKELAQMVAIGGVSGILKAGARIGISQVGMFSSFGLTVAAASVTSGTISLGRETIRQFRTERSGARSAEWAQARDDHRTLIGASWSYADKRRLAGALAKGMVTGAIGSAIGIEIANTGALDSAAHFLADKLGWDTDATREAARVAAEKAKQAAATTAGGAGATIAAAAGEAGKAVSSAASSVASGAGEAVSGAVSEAGKAAAGAATTIEDTATKVGEGLKDFYGSRGATTGLPTAPSPTVEQGGGFIADRAGEAGRTASGLFEGAKAKVGLGGQQAVDEAAVSLGGDKIAVDEAAKTGGGIGQFVSDRAGEAGRTASRLAGRGGEQAATGAAVDAPPLDETASGYEKIIDAQKKMIDAQIADMHKLADKFSTEYQDHLKAEQNLVDVRAADKIAFEQTIADLKADNQALQTQLAEAQAAATSPQAPGAGSTPAGADAGQTTQIADLKASNQALQAQLDEANQKLAEAGKPPVAVTARVGADTAGAASSASDDDVLERAAAAGRTAAGATKSAVVGAPDANALHNVIAPTGARIEGSVVDNSLTYNGESWVLAKSGLVNIHTINPNLNVDQGLMAQKLQEATVLWSKGQLNQNTNPDLWRLFHLSNNTTSVFPGLMANTDDETIKSFIRLGVVKK